MFYNNVQTVSKEDPSYMKIAKREKMKGVNRLVSTFNLDLRII